MKNYFYLLLIVLVLVGCKKPDESSPVVQNDTLTPYPYLKPKYLKKELNEPIDNQASIQGVALGRMLFYDKQLSIDGSISCASCHRQDLAFTDGLATSKGLNNFILPRSSMSLSNKVWEVSQMWDGRHGTMEDLIHDPLTNVHEMGSNYPLVIGRLQSDLRYKGKWRAAFLKNDSVTQPRIEKAISQFIRSLQSVNSKYDKYLRGEIDLTADEEAGRLLFFTHPDPMRSLRGGNCGDCHTPGNLGGDVFEYKGFKNNGISITNADLDKDVGLMNVTGNARDLAKFKITSLRNIELTAPYMHDGRIATLEAVLDHYNSLTLFQNPGIDSTLAITTNNRFGSSLGLTAEEKRKIIVFMKTFTDTSFIKNPAYSNPF